MIILRNKKITEIIVVTIILFLLAYFAGVALPRIPSALRIIIGVFYYTLMMSIIFFVVKKVDKQKLEIIGLSTNDLAKQILIGIGIFIIILILVITALLLGADKQYFVNPKPKSIVVIIYYTFYGIIFVGFGEEIIFRGFFLERIKIVLNSSIWAVLISSVLFAVWHYPTTHNIPPLALLFGIIFSVCRLKIKRCGIVSLAIAHGLNDALAIWLGFFLL